VGRDPDASAPASQAGARRWQVRPIEHDWAWVPPAPKPWKARLVRLGFSLFAAVLLTGAWAYSLVLYSETPWVALPVGMLFWGVSYEVSKGVR
jgi:hypothetical protein